MQKFVVPGPPQGKGRARTVSRGGKTHSFTPQRTVQYESLVALAYRLAYPDTEPTANPVRLLVEAYMPIPQSWPKSKQAAALNGTMLPTVKPDADNVLKCVLDSINGIAWVDDKQVTDAEIVKRYAAIPRVEVTITEVTA